jgi:hypothetical protein
MDLVEVGAQRVGHEVLFPQTGREQMDLEGVMGIDPLQDIDEVDVRVNSLQPARGKEALHHSDIAGAHFGPQNNQFFLPMAMGRICRST